MSTKQDITEQLDAIGIKYPSNAPKETLWALLPPTIASLMHSKDVAEDEAEKAKAALEAKSAKDAEEAKNKVAEPNSREERWEAFLAKAEKHHPRQFAIDKARGEFDIIPEHFQ